MDQTWLARVTATLRRIVKAALLFAGVTSPLVPCAFSSFSQAETAPGTVTQVLKDRVLVATGEGQLAILRFQAPGKKAMDMAAFLLGRRMEPGERFEEIH